MPTIKTGEHLYRKGGTKLRGPGRPAGSVDLYRVAVKAGAPLAVVEDIMRRLATKAMAGDVPSAALVLRYTTPEIKAQHVGITDLVGETSADKLQYLLSHIASGNIDSAAGSVLLRGLQFLAAKEAAEAEGKALTAEDIMRMIRSEDRAPKEQSNVD